MTYRPRRPRSTIAALDFGLHQLDYCNGLLHDALADRDARTETALAYLYRELQDNKKAIKAIRRVAEAVDDVVFGRGEARYAQVTQIKSVAQFTRDYLVDMGRRAKARS